MQLLHYLDLRKYNKNKNKDIKIIIYSRINNNNHLKKN
jgi:hypothetical protein